MSCVQVDFVDPVERNIKILADILTENQLSFDIVLRARSAGCLRCIGPTKNLTDVPMRGLLRLVFDVEYWVEKNGPIIEESISGLEPPSAELITVIGRFLRVSVKRADQLVRKAVFDLDLLCAVARQTPSTPGEVVVHVELDLAGSLCVLAVKYEVSLVTGVRVANVEGGEQR